MREVKFRAYQKRPSLHRKPGVYTVTDLVFYPNHGGGEAFLAKDDEEALSSEYLEDIVLEQYTGRKDIEGNEIYEGDLLLATKYDDSARPVIVTFDTKSAAFKANGVISEYQIKKYGLKVIGHIHEAPDDWSPAEFFANTKPEGES